MVNILFYRNVHDIVPERISIKISRKAFEEVLGNDYAYVSSPIKETIIVANKEELDIENGNFQIGRHFYIRKLDESFDMRSSFASLTEEDIEKITEVFTI